MNQEMQNKGKLFRKWGALETTVETGENTRCSPDEQIYLSCSHLSFGPYATISLATHVLTVSKCTVESVLVERHL